MRTAIALYLMIQRRDIPLIIFTEKKLQSFTNFVGEFTQLLSVFGGRITVSPEEFNNSSDKIFAAQFQSAREGVNLATADCIIMFNVDFAAVSYWQARARLQAKDRKTPAMFTGYSLKAVLSKMFLSKEKESTLFFIIGKKFFNIFVKKIMAYFKSRNAV